MPKAPAQAASAEPNPTLQESFEAALAALPQGDAAPDTSESPSASDREQGEPEPTGQKSASDTAKEQAAREQEPDHIRWAKSVEGNLQDGQLNVDRITKQAFESNKQLQTLSQQMAQLTGVLRHPKVEEALRSIVLPSETAPKGTPEEEKTDEQILDDFVGERIKKAIEPILPQVSVLKQKYVQSECELTYQRMREDFGRVDDNDPKSGFVYDSVRDEVTRVIATAAQQAGVSLLQLMEYLVDSGNLHQTFSNATKSLLYPRIREQVGRVKTQSVDEKKRLRTTPSGNSGARPAAKNIQNFRDAVDAALAENPEFKKLQ